MATATETDSPATVTDEPAEDRYAEEPVVKAARALAEAAEELCQAVEFADIVGGEPGAAPEVRDQAAAGWRRALADVEYRFALMAGCIRAQREHLHECEGAWPSED